MLTLQLKDATDVEIVVSALRGAEKSTRSGFAKWMCENLDNPDIMAKVERSRDAVKRIVEIRAALGDTKPVKM